MSFTDQKPRTVTESDLKMRYNARNPREGFRCYMCGHQFELNDYWRWQYSQRFCNFLVCEKCDGPDVVERWIAHNEEWKSLIKYRFWHAAYNLSAQ